MNALKRVEARKEYKRPWLVGPRLVPEQRARLISSGPNAGRVRKGATMNAEKQPDVAGPLEPTVRRLVPKRAKDCKLPECNGMPRCKTCVAMDAAYPTPEDRELLARAAAAADCGVRWEVDHGCYSVSDGGYGTRRWNPLADDGDALRLAVRMRITMYPAECVHDGATTTWAHPDSEWIVVTPTNDAAADMRRAIVVAAVAMGNHERGTGIVDVTGPTARENK